MNGFYFSNDFADEIVTFSKMEHYFGIFRSNYSSTIEQCGSYSWPADRRDAVILGIRRLRVTNVTQPQTTLHSTSVSWISTSLMHIKIGLILNLGSSPQFHLSPSLNWASRVTAWSSTCRGGQACPVTRLQLQYKNPEPVRKRSRESWWRWREEVIRWKCRPEMWRQPWVIDISTSCGSQPRVFEVFVYFYCLGFVLIRVGLLLFFSEVSIILLSREINHSLQFTLLLNSSTFAKSWTTFDLRNNVNPN